MTNNDDIPNHSAKKKNKKEPESIEKYLMQEIKIPLDDQWKEYFKEFVLSAEQERALKETITNINGYIIKYNTLMKKIGPRSERKKKLLALEKSLDKVRFYVEHFGDDMDNWLPSEACAQIGLLSDFLTAEQVLGETKYSMRINQRIEQEIFLKSSVNIEKIDKELSFSRESIGLLVGGKILRNFIQKIHDPLRDWVELERLNKGGAPGNMTVRLIVRELARWAPEIIGVRAAIKKEGLFVRLCSAVLIACGLPDASDNVGNMVPNVVKKLRAR